MCFGGVGWVGWCNRVRGACVAFVGCVVGWGWVWVVSVVVFGCDVHPSGSPCGVVCWLWYGVGQGRGHSSGTRICVCVGLLPPRSRLGFWLAGRRGTLFCGAVHS